MSFFVLVGITVDETIDAGSTKSGCCDALAFCTGPGARDFAAAESFYCAGNQRSFGGLLPFL